MDSGFCDNKIKQLFQEYVYFAVSVLIEVKILPLF